MKPGDHRTSEAREPRGPDGRRPRAVTLVGLMGVGKTTIGRRLASALRLPFFDADTEIERAAALTVAEIFERFGETYFREGERRVIARILDGTPLVLATGGGAFMDPSTRALIKQKALSVWLRADLDVLMRRVSRRDTRPLLRTEDPRAVMRRLMEERYPVYAQADIVVDSLDGPHERTVAIALEALRRAGAAGGPEDLAR
ncbi:MAG: shikimate kinase [Caulobacterales bacterium]|nr:shikimate kinase [Caulobacterales bacterium]